MRRVPHARSDTRKPAEHLDLDGEHVRMSQLKPPNIRSGGANPVDHEGELSIGEAICLVLFQFGEVNRFGKWDNVDL